jgi:hypothetical protein
MSELTRLKKILYSQEFKDKILKDIEKLQEEEFNQLKYFYPKHETHNFVFKEDKYFEAMFEYVSFDCECGQVLTLTRDMMKIHKEQKL